MFKVLFYSMILLGISKTYASIKITSALWGSKDVYANASQFCDSKTSCQYKVAKKFIGDYEGDTKTFDIAWICYNDESTEQKIRLPHDAENEIITLDCSKVVKKLPAFTASQEQKDIEKANKQRRASFRNVFLSPKLNKEIREDLGDKCFNFIHNIYSQDKTLYSEMLNRTIEPLSTINFKSGVQDLKFYHWTYSTGLHELLQSKEKDRSKAHKNALNNGSYEAMFTFLRTRDADMYNLWRRLFYVAEDALSSNFLGNKLITFQLSPHCRSIGWDDKSWIDALEELEQKYQGLQDACGEGLPRTVNDTFRTVNYNEILHIIAEDSGVDIIDFQTKEWFQILTPFCFEETFF